MELQRCILLFTLAAAAAPLAQAHEELYNGCLVDHSNFVPENEITPGPDPSMMIDTLDKCDDSCIGQLACTYFSWDHIQGRCRWFTGVFADAPTTAMRFSVSGMEGCSAHMQQQDKEPCANPAQAVLSFTYGSCQASPQALECNIAQVKPLMSSSCSYCGESVTCPTDLAPYTLCEGDEHETPNQDSVVTLKIHCTGVCTDVEVRLDMLRGHYDRMGFMDDYESGQSCYSRNRGHGSGPCENFENYNFGGEYLNGTFTFQDDSFYAEITDYLYMDTNYLGDYDEVKYAVTMGSGNGYAITCHSERGNDEIDDTDVRSEAVPARLERLQKERSGAN